MVDMGTMETNNGNFLTVDTNKVSGSHALELRTYCHPGAPSMSSILFPWSLGLGKDKSQQEPNNSVNLLPT